MGARTVQSEDSGRRAGGGAGAADAAWPMAMATSGSEGGDVDMRGLLFGGTTAREARATASAACQLLPGFCPSVEPHDRGRPLSDQAALRTTYMYAQRPEP